jgi:hypothetical protein
MLNKIVDSMKAYGGIASVAQILNTKRTGYYLVNL